MGRNLPSALARRYWPLGQLVLAAAITAKYPWLVVARDSCETVVDLNLRVKPRDPEALIHAALRDLRCPRPRIVALARQPTI